VDKTSPETVIRVSKKPVHIKEKVPFPKVQTADVASAKPGTYNISETDYKSKCLAW
jgi:hypothetical protein